MAAEVVAPQAAAQALAAQTAPVLALPLAEAVVEVPEQAVAALDTLELVQAVELHMAVEAWVEAWAQAVVAALDAMELVLAVEPHMAPVPACALPWEQVLASVQTPAQETRHKKPLPSVACKSSVSCRRSRRAGGNRTIGIPSPRFWMSVDRN